jgi:hypothetical protein
MSLYKGSEFQLKLHDFRFYLWPYVYICNFAFYLNEIYSDSQLLVKILQKKKVEFFGDFSFYTDPLYFWVEDIQVASGLILPMTSKLKRQTWALQIELKEKHGP